VTFSSVRVLEFVVVTVVEVPVDDDASLFEPYSFCHYFTKPNKSDFMRADLTPDFASVFGVTWLTSSSLLSQLIVSSKNSKPLSWNTK